MPSLSPSGLFIACLLLAPRVAHAQTSPDPPLPTRESLLAPAEGRTAVIITSPDEPEVVGITSVAGTLSARALAADELHRSVCRTPCTLYVPSGVHAIVTRGDRRLSAVTPIVVHAGDATQTYRIETSLRSGMTAQTVTAVVGLLLGLYGGIFAGATWSHFDQGDPTLPVIGLGSLGVGVGLLAISAGLSLTRTWGLVRTGPEGVPRTAWTITPRLGPEGAAVEVRF